MKENHFMRTFKAFVRKWRWALLLSVTALAFYGSIRLYFHLTDGFSVAHIVSDRPYNSELETRPLKEEEKELIYSLFDQEFHYLGKGCQSYVFASDDGDYVLKFFKYQRYRQKPWLKYFSFIPSVREYKERREAKKNRKLENLLRSCRIAFDNLQNETGLVYLHLNKTDEFKKTLTIYDKLGIKHELNIDNLDFMIQKRALMICSAVDALMAERKVDEANRLIQNFISMILSEYGKGLADNDHALMQNTGIYKGKPIHVDVGQFVWHERIRDRKVYKQELFNKTYKFRVWLAENHPELLDPLDARLHRIIGKDFDNMEPTHLAR